MKKRTSAVLILSLIALAGCSSSWGGSEPAPRSHTTVVTPAGSTSSTTTSP